MDDDMAMNMTDDMAMDDGMMMDDMMMDDSMQMDDMGGMMMMDDDMGMVMTFGNWDDYELKLLFDSWDIKKEYQFVLSCLCVALAAVVLHGVRRFRSLLHRHIKVASDGSSPTLMEVMQNVFTRKTTGEYGYAGAGAPAAGGRASQNKQQQGGQIQRHANTTLVLGTEQQDAVLHENLLYTSAPGPGSSAPGNNGGLPSAQVPPRGVISIPRACLYGLVSALLYGLSLMLMLVAMTYNPWLFTSLVIGYGLGETFFVLCEAAGFGPDPAFNKSFSAVSMSPDDATDECCGD